MKNIFEKDFGKEVDGEEDIAIVIVFLAIFSLLVISFYLFKL